QDSSNISQSNDFASERKDTQAQSKGNNYNLFTLDEEWEEEVEKPISVNQPKSKVEEIPTVEEDMPKMMDEKPQVQKEIVEEDPLDEHVSGNISQQIEERRDRLKEFKCKSKTELNEYDVDEAENIPAYKRKQIELSEHKREKSGGYIVDRDSSNEIKIRPNNFLHDNVD